MTRVSFSGISVVILIGAMVGLHFYLWPSPGPEQAEKRIRLILKMEISHRHAAKLKERGRRLPDHGRALQWKRELERINHMKFLSAEVNRLIPDVFLLSDNPHFVVRATLRHVEGPDETRYFLLSTDGTDRETSYTAWFFSM